MWIPRWLSYTSPCMPQQQSEFGCGPDIDPALQMPVEETLIIVNVAQHQDVTRTPSWADYVSPAKPSHGGG